MKSKVFLGIIVAMLSGLAVTAQTYGDYDLYIDVTGNGGAHNTVIYFDDEVSWDTTLFPTYGWDPCCDANSFGVTSGYPQIYTQVVEPPLPPNNNRLSLNGLPHLTEPIDVPLGFIPPALTQYTFSFTELNTLPMGTVVELEDLPQSVTQDLMADSTYVTWGAESDDEERFIIHFYPSSITGVQEEANADQVKVSRRNGLLHVSGLSAVMARRLKLYDLQGRQLIDERIADNEQGHDLDMSGSASGIFVLTIETANTGLINLKVAF